jgi:hypothetical protein
VTIPVNEIIKFVNEHSQLVLEIEGEATTEGTRAEQYTDTGGDHQRWRVKPAGPGNEDFYNIENVHSTMSLEVVGYSTEPGAEIVQRPYGDGPLHRQWKLVPVTGKTDVYKIENRNSGLVLDDVWGQTDAPAPVKQYAPWDDDGRQQWKLILVPAPVTPTPATPTPATPTPATPTPAAPTPAPPVPRKVALVNGGFEQPIVTHSRGWDLFADAFVPGWTTTAPDRLIELWRSGTQQYAELNAVYVSTLYQNVETTPGTTLSWGLWHRGVVGVDTMAVDIGAPGAVIEQRRITDGQAWGYHSGTYTVPAGQTITRFACRSISAAAGRPDVGNFIDHVFFGTV